VLGGDFVQETRTLPCAGGGAFGLLRSHRDAGDDVHDGGNPSCDLAGVARDVADRGGLLLDGRRDGRGERVDLLCSATRTMSAIEVTLRPVLR
jgi:hypothetical protein